MLIYSLQRVLLIGVDDHFPFSWQNCPLHISKKVEVETHFVFWFQNCNRFRKQNSTKIPSCPPTPKLFHVVLPVIKHDPLPMTCLTQGACLAASLLFGSPGGGVLMQDVPAVVQGGFCPQDGAPLSSYTWGYNPITIWPLVGNEGSSSPIYLNVKVEGPSYPTKGQPDKSGFLDPSYPFIGGRL